MSGRDVKEVVRHPGRVAGELEAVQKTVARADGHAWTKAEVHVDDPHRIDGQGAVFDGVAGDEFDQAGLEGIKGPVEIRRPAEGPLLGQPVDLVLRLGPPPREHRPGRFEDDG